MQPLVDKVQSYDGGVSTMLLYIMGTSRRVLK